MPKVAFECNFWLVFHSALPHEKTETSWTSLRLRFGTGTAPLSFICEPSHSISISIAMRLCVPVSVCECEWVSVLCVNNNKQMNKWIRLFLLHRVVIVRLRWVIRYSEIDWRPDKTIVTAAIAAAAAATDGCKVLNEAWFPWFAYMLKLISSDSKNENWFVVQWSEFNETFYHLTDFLSLQQKGRERTSWWWRSTSYISSRPSQILLAFSLEYFQQFGTTTSRASVSKLNDAVQSISQWQMAMRTLEWSMFLWDLITFGDFH